jgi:hypothetical protein
MVMRVCDMYVLCDCTAQSIYVRTFLRNNAGLLSNSSRYNTTMTRREKYREMHSTHAALLDLYSIPTIDLEVRKWVGEWVGGGGGEGAGGGGGGWLATLPTAVTPARITGQRAPTLRLLVHNLPTRMMLITPA